MKRLEDRQKQGYVINEIGDIWIQMVYYIFKQYYIQINVYHIFINYHINIIFFNVSHPFFLE